MSYMAHQMSVCDCKKDIRKWSVEYIWGTPDFERYGQNEKRIKRYVKNVPIIYHITVCKIRVNVEVGTSKYPDRKSDVTCGCME